MPDLRNPLYGATYLVAAQRTDQLPPDAGSEVAFAGRSNAGKSSALNALTGHAQLARTSKTPGRTRQLMAFVLPDGNRLIDLPGFGYAKVPQAMRAQWQGTIDAYLRRRRSLRGLVLITDIRHALTSCDRQMLACCDAVQLPCVVLLSKADKLTRGRALARRQAIEREIRQENWGAPAMVFSVRDHTGVEAARDRIAELLRGTAAVHRGDIEKRS